MGPAAANDSTGPHCATVPIRIRSESNLREHWRVKSKRTQRERGAGRLAAGVVLHKSKMLCLPVEVKLVRIIGPRGRALDAHDNLRTAFKHFVDGIAEQLGVDDGDKSKVVWEYAEERGKEWAARVEIRSLAEALQALAPEAG